ncbi:MAG: hypothetical protein NT013_19630 [Planctomycetia bacterium]|nr:hypothetical protein [Planctomycetia bacterium]
MLKVLRRLDADYRPTYENRANYVELVNETVAEMNGETEIVHGSKWDTSPLTKETWFGHWENDTGYWLIITDAIGRTIRVHRSGDSMPEMTNVVLSPDSQVLKFSEGDQWNHTVTLVNKYEATHEWRNAKSDQVWRTESLHKLVRATPDMKHVTQVCNQSADDFGTQP